MTNNKSGASYPRERPRTRHEDTYNSGHPRVIQEHPAYGRVTITHPPGGNVEMFGSDIVHNERVALRIDHAYEEVTNGIPEYRSQSGSRGGRVVEIEMTAFQWAGLVASHSGNGVPCTLRYVSPTGIGNLPLIQSQNTSEEQATREVKASLEVMMQKHSEGLEVLRELVSKGKATKKELQAALEKFSYIHAKLPDVTSYALHTFTEHAENVVAKSNAEVEANINSIIRRTGIKALGMRQDALEDKS